MKPVSEIHENLNIPEEASRTGKRSIKILLESLKEMEKEAERLKRVETEFLATRNAELLKPFALDKSSINYIKLKQPIVEPHYLSNIPQLLEEAKTPEDKQMYERRMKELLDDAKRFNPDAEIKIVEETDGRKSLAVIGVDFDEFDGFRGLRNKERHVERDKARTQRDLGETIANYPAITNQPTEESHSYIPAIVPVNPAIAASRKAIHH